MSRPGRKRKPGYREPNGRLQRPGKPSLAMLLAIQDAQRLAETALVLAQPHRRGNPSHLCATALGRLVEAHEGGNRTLYDAGERYAGLVRRWRAAWGMKEAVIARSITATGNGPSDATVRGWRRQIDSLDERLRRSSEAVRFAIVHLVLDNKDLIGHEVGHARIGLRILARELGMVEKDHPYR